MTPFARALVDALDLMDTDGRPLTEAASNQYTPGATDEIPCPYPDSRRGHTMNRSALLQISEHWTSVTSTVGALVGNASTTHRAWRACIVATAAPLAFHAQNNRPIPADIAALYKACVGFAQVFGTLLLTNDGVADQPLASLGDSEAFFTFLDDGRWLHGQSQVCSGTRAMIGGLFDILAGTAASESDAIEFDVSGLPDNAAEVVGVQAAYLAAAYQLARGGDGDCLAGTPAEHWLNGGAPPWLMGVLAQPNPLPEFARRLFPDGESPARLDTFIERWKDSPRQLVEHFEQALS